MAAVFDTMPSAERASSGRVPPHSLEAERAVLGGILLENNALNTVTVGSMTSTQLDGLTSGQLTALNSTQFQSLTTAGSFPLIRPAKERASD